jgi:hypothetical protein
MVDIVGFQILPVEHNCFDWNLRQFPRMAKSHVNISILQMPLLNSTLVSVLDVKYHNSCFDLIVF